MNNNKFYVSRQNYYGEENPLCVEIAIGGSDYSNPDQLVAKYSGEAKEYTDPVEAAKVAIEIATKWRKDENKTADEITVRWGCTGGMTLYFDESTDQEVTEWAQERYDKIPKCDQCGEPLPGEGDQYILYDYNPDARYCSQKCANKAWAFYQEADDELSQLEDEG